MTINRELKEARDLLEKAERELDSAQKIATLNDAFSLLDIYCEEHHPLLENEEILINNLRYSHTRRLLSQLKELSQVEIEVWIKYFSLLGIKLKPQVDAIIQQDDMLSEAFSQFIDLWREEFLEIINSYKGSS